MAKRRGNPGLLRLDSEERTAALMTMAIRTSAGGDSPASGSGPAED